MSEDKTELFNRTIDILQHEIEFWFEDCDGNIRSELLPEADSDHIEESIKEGYNQGELNVAIFVDDIDEPIECTGWWRIKK